MGHHAQQPFLDAQPLDQGFVLLTQHQQLVLELHLPLAAAAIHLRRPQAQPQGGDHLHLLPAGQPDAQLLGQGVAGEDLLGQGIELDQGRGGHQAVQFEQLGMVGRIGHLEETLQVQSSDCRKASRARRSAEAM